MVSILQFILIALAEVFRMKNSVFSRLFYCCLCMGLASFVECGRGAPIFPYDFVSLPAATAIPNTTRWSPDSKKILVRAALGNTGDDLGEQNGGVVFDVSTLQLLFRLQEQGIRQDIVSAEFSEQGDLIVTTGTISGVSAITVWDARNGTKIAQFTDKDFTFSSAYFFKQDSQIVFYGKKSHEFFFWDYKNNSLTTWLSGDFDNADLQLSLDRQSAIMLGGTAPLAGRIDIVNLKDRNIFFSHVLTNAEWNEESIQGFPVATLLEEAVSPLANYAVQIYRIERWVSQTNSTLMEPSQTSLFVWNTHTGVLLYKTRLFTSEPLFSVDEQNVSFYDSEAQAIKFVRLPSGEETNALQLGSQDVLSERCSKWLFTIHSEGGDKSEIETLYDLWSLSSQKWVATLRIRDRSNSGPMSAGGYDMNPSCSPDGTTILFWRNSYSTALGKADPMSSQGYLWDVNGL